MVMGVAGWMLRPRKWALGLMAASGVVVDPLLGVATIAAVAGAYYWRSIVRQRALRRTRAADALLALDLLALGSTAGLSFLSAAMAASAEVGGEVASEIRRSVRRVQAGLGPDSGDGPLAEAFQAAERSAVTGASLADGLVDLARNVRADEATKERERLERLPVKLLFPLAFLILPGFVLVVVVPSIVSGLSQLTL